MKRFFFLLLPLFAFFALVATSSAQGIKCGQASVLIPADGIGTASNPVAPGGTATFQYSLTRNNHNGAAGNFVATLTYSAFSPSASISYAAGTPTSINLLQKVATNGFFFNVNVGANVLPGIYHFTVLAFRT